MRSLARARRSAHTQVVLLAVCHLCSVGMWNGLNAIGSLGTADAALAHYCNSVMYLTGIVGGVVGGGIVNVVGIRLGAITGLFCQSSTLLFYYLYYYRRAVSLRFVVLYNGAASVGISCLTSAIGTALVHYPTEPERNKFIAVASAVLNLGGLMGGLLSVAMNASPTPARHLSETSYLAVVFISALGLLIGVTLVLPAARVRRSDHKAPTYQFQPFLSEVRAVAHEFANPFLLLLTPLFLVNVWHEVVLFNYMNSGLFNIRSRAVNSCVYYVARILASFVFRSVCDAGAELAGQTRNALWLVAALLALGAGTSALVFARAFGLGNPNSLLDITELRASVLLLAFAAYGSLETISSSLTYWLLGELNVGSKETRNRLVGLSRSFINVGGCISWCLDMVHVSPFVQWLISLAVWLATIVGVLAAARRSLKTSEPPLAYSARPIGDTSPSSEEASPHAAPLV